MTTKKHSSWNSPLMWAGFAIYGALLILFGWQTWQFVNWLFPDDQLLAKILTMISFDLLAAFWALVHTFYRFASRGAKAWVIIAWALTFVLSLVASVLYLVIQFYFRFNLSVSPTMINIGYAVSILALVFNILALMSWLILEHQKRHPRQDEFDKYEEEDDTALHSPARGTYTAAEVESMIDRAVNTYALSVHADYQNGTSIPHAESGDQEANPRHPLAGTASLNSEGTTEKPKMNGHQK